MLMRDGSYIKHDMLDHDSLLNEILYSISNGTEFNILKSTYISSLFYDEIIIIKYYSSIRSSLTEGIINCFTWSIEIGKFDGHVLDIGIYKLIYSRDGREISRTYDKIALYQDDICHPGLIDEIIYALEDKMGVIISC